MRLSQNDCHNFYFVLFDFFELFCKCDVPYWGQSMIADEPKGTLGGKIIFVHIIIIIIVNN